MWFFDAYKKILSNQSNCAFKGDLLQNDPQMEQEQLNDFSGFSICSWNFPIEQVARSTDND